MPSLLPALEKKEYEPVTRVLARLAENPPQTMLLEGGTEEDRLQLGKYWAMLQNCSHATVQEGYGSRPCLTCKACRLIASGDWRDLQIFDGRISNRQDEEKPDIVKSLRMENIRDLKSVLAAKPQNSEKRVILVQGMGITREEAQNSLLKVLEDPVPHNLFVLLVSQRQQILPTLVSRSFCLSLPWNDARSSYASMDKPALYDDFCLFLENGRGLLDKLGQKGQLDTNGAAMLIFELQKTLVRVLASSKTDCALDKVFAAIAHSPEKIFSVGRWLSDSLEMLDLGVAPARVLEALASRLYVLMRQTNG